MTYITTPGFTGVDLTETSIDKRHRLGTEVQGSDGNTWRYVKVNLPAASGEVHSLNEAGEAFTYSSTANIGAIPLNVCFIQHSFNINEYGWVVVKGINFLSQADGGTSADTKSYTSTIASRFNGTSAGSVMYQGLRANAAGADSTDISCSSAGYAEANAQT